MAAYKLISSDSHLEIPPERWRAHVATKYRDQAPRTVTLPDGGDAFVVEGLPPAPVTPLDSRAGRSEQEWQPFGLRMEDAAGAGSPAQHVEELTVDGLDAEVLFPANQRGYILWRGIKDDEAYKAVVRGYNEWLAEEYCAFDPARLIGLGVIPSTNVADAVEELRHCAELGLKGVVLGTLPDRKPHPTPEDDRFWAAALELAMPVTVHVEFQTGMAPKGQAFVYPHEDPEIIEKMGPRGLLEVMTKHGSKSVDGHSVWQLVLSGVFDRFPELQIFFAETRLGWIPFWLEQSDLWYQRHLPWAEDLLGFKALDRLPSEYVKEHIYWSVQYERFALRNLDIVGRDRVMFATDFPHVESEWPNSKPIIEEIYANVPENDRDMVWAGNAVRFFGL